jgi:hypothetical protein
MLARSRAAEDHARLQAEGQAHRAFRDAEAARRVEIEKLRGDIGNLVDDRDQLLALASTASDALARLFIAARERGAHLGDLAGRARVLGVAQMSTDDTVRDPSGIGWRKDPQAAGPARVQVDDVALGAVDPKRLTARLVREVLDRAGQRTDGFSLANAGPPVAEQIASTVREVPKPELVRVRVVKKWGAHRAGEIAEIDHESAVWARTKGLVVPA